MTRPPSGGPAQFTGLGAFWPGCVWMRLCHASRRNARECHTRWWSGSV